VHQVVRLISPSRSPLLAAPHEKTVSEQDVSRVLFLEGVTPCEAMTIHLVSALPPRSSDLPGDSGGPPFSVPLFGLAPGGVCRAPAVTGGAGELLPHRFTLTRSEAETSERAVCFLWHFPSRHRDWALPSALSFGARTFLPPARLQGSGHLSYSDTEIPPDRRPANHR